MFTARLPREAAIVLVQHLSDHPNLSRFGWAKTNTLKFSHKALPSLLIRCHREGILHPENAKLWRTAYKVISRAADVPQVAFRVEVTEDDIRAYLSDAENAHDDLRAITARAALNGNTFKREFVTSAIVRQRLVSLGVTV